MDFGPRRSGRRCDSRHSRAHLGFGRNPSLGSRWRSAMPPLLVAVVMRVFDHFLLLTIDPACENDDVKLPRLKHEVLKL